MESIILIKEFKDYINSTYDLIYAIQIIIVVMFIFAVIGLLKEMIKNKKEKNKNEKNEI